MDKHLVICVHHLVICGHHLETCVHHLETCIFCTAILIIFSQYYTPDSQTNLGVVTLMKPSMENVCGM